jgi:hypothetical protein
VAAGSATGGTEGGTAGRVSAVVVATVVGRSGTVVVRTPGVATGFGGGFRAGRVDSWARRVAVAVVPGAGDGGSGIAMLAVGTMIGGTVGASTARPATDGGGPDEPNVTQPITAQSTA